MQKHSLPDINNKPKIIEKKVVDSSGGSVLRAKRHPVLSRALIKDFG